MSFDEARDVIQDAFDKVEDAFNTINEQCPHIQVFSGKLEDGDMGTPFHYEQCNHPDKIFVLGYTGCRLKACPLIM